LVPAPLSATVMTISARRDRYHAHPREHLLSSRC
jgi:hypothetical protein